MIYKSEYLKQVTGLFAMELTAVAGAAAPSVFDDNHRIGLCVIGSAIGAFLTISVFPTESMTDSRRVRRMGIKFGGSMLGSIAFAPAIIEYGNLSRTSDMLVAISAFTAVFCVSGIHLVAPKLEKMLDRLVKVE